MTQSADQIAEEAKALVNQGVKTEDLSPGQVGGGNKVPVDDGVNKPVPPKTDAELAAEKKTQEDKDAAEKAERDAAKVTDPDIGVTKWAEIEHPAGAAVIGLLKDAGISPMEGNAIFQKAVASGNLDDVDWDALEKKLPADKFLLAKAGVDKYYEEEYAPIRETAKKAYEIVGGEENWDKMRAWAQKAEVNDPELKKEVDKVRKAIAQNGWVAEKGIERLKELYEKAPNNKGLGTGKRVEGGAPSKDTGTALTREQYRAEINKLHEGMREPNPSDVAALRARRQAGMQKGI